MNKLIISSQSLKAALAKLSSVVSGKHPLPVLSNVKCIASANSLEMIGTNTEITIKLEVECECPESFEFLLPFEFANKIVSITKHAPLEIQAGKKIKLLADGDTYELKVGSKIEEFPGMPALPEKGFKLYGDVLTSLDTALATVAKSNHSNQALTNVLLSFTEGKVTVVSTDGSRSVYTNEMESEGQATEDFLINQKIIKLLDPAADIKVYFNEKFISFQSEKQLITCTRSEYKFVNYQAVFPADWPANLTLTREHALNALAKCSLANDQLHETKLDFSAEGKMRLTANDEVIKIDLSLDAKYNGTVQTIYVTGDKLMAMLGQIDSEEVELAIHDINKAIVLTRKDAQGYKGLLMPIAQAIVTEKKIVK